LTFLEHLPNLRATSSYKNVHLFVLTGSYKEVTANLCREQSEAKLFWFKSSAKRALSRTHAASFIHCVPASLLQFTQWTETRSSSLAQG